MPQSILRTKRELLVALVFAQAVFLGCASTADAQQWGPRGMSVEPTPGQQTPVQYGPTPVPMPVAVPQPAVVGQYAVQPGVYQQPAAIPTMPPPPGVTVAGVAPPTIATGNNTVYLAQATTPVPPVVTGPPIAQGFGTNVPPVASTPPSIYGSPAPALGGVFTAPDWGTATFVPSQYVKFVQSVRLRHTFVAGEDDPDEFGMNDSEVAATFALPEFLFSQQPLLITPGFILHLWDPPMLEPTALSDGELPPRVYSAYVDFYWTPRLNERLSTELDLRLGVYSDFQSAGSDAFRPQAYAALIYQNPGSPWAIKGGATYINRERYEVLPVFGLIYTPDQFTYFDITFPNPKISHYGWRWGNTDVWWYIAGEYGGGSWEIDDITGQGLANGGQRVDVNDLRAIAGLEWTGGWVGAKGFLEIGYVFERELFSKAAGGRILQPDDSVMVRGGITF